MIVKVSDFVGSWKLVRNVKGKPLSGDNSFSHSHRHLMLVKRKVGEAPIE